MTYFFTIPYTEKTKNWHWTLSTEPGQSTCATAKTLQIETMREDIILRHIIVNISFTNWVKDAQSSFGDFLGRKKSVPKAPLLGLSSPKNPIGIIKREASLESHDEAKNWSAWERVGFVKSSAWSNACTKVTTNDSLHHYAVNWAKKNLVNSVLEGTTIPSMSYGSLRKRRKENVQRPHVESLQIKTIRNYQAVDTAQKDSLLTCKFAGLILALSSTCWICLLLKFESPIDRTKPWSTAFSISWQCI